MGEVRNTQESNEVTCDLMVMHYNTMHKKLYTNKNILIIGAARTGIACANLLIKHGAHVSMCDIQTQQALSPLVDSLDSHVTT